MDLTKPYWDTNGDECNILQLIKKEPEWAANRIQAGEEAIKKLKGSAEQGPRSADGYEEKCGSDGRGEQEVMVKEFLNKKGYDWATRGIKAYLLVPGIINMDKEIDIPKLMYEFSNYLSTGRVLRDV